MQAASIEKQVRDLQEMVDAMSQKREIKQTGILKRAIRMLQEQQAKIALKKKVGIDLRPSKTEENAQMARVGRAYQKARKASKSNANLSLEDFHGSVDTLIAKD